VSARGAFDLGGRVALVTGSTRGLGLVLARGLARAGAVVCLNGRRAEAVAEAAEGLAAAGVAAHQAPFDVTDEEAVEDAVARIERDVGSLAVLVSNAGIQHRAPFVEFPLPAWRSVLDVNLTGPFVVGRAVARRMVPRGTGKIVNVGSVQSRIARPTIAAYSTAKGGLLMLTRGMCAELAPHGIQVNAIGPGYLVTELNRALLDDADFDAWLRARTPAGRWGDPQELVGAVVFLASDASSFVNGQILYVDGGMTAVV
jgi:gluconate 5-dehydrogenase